MATCAKFKFVAQNFGMFTIDKISAANVRQRGVPLKFLNAGDFVSFIVDLSLGKWRLVNVVTSVGLDCPTKSELSCVYNVIFFF